jgi:uncharacterized protein YecT (DUF1311 family)
MENINLKFFLVLFGLFPAFSASAHEKEYDLANKCGLYFKSTYDFYKSKDTDVKCTMSQNISNSHYTGYVYSEEIGLYEYGEDFISRISEVNRNFNDGESLTTQKWEKINTLKKSPEDMIRVSLIKYRRLCNSPFTQYKECNLKQKYFTEIYECWNAVIYGKAVDRVAVARLLCSYHKPGQKFASLNSWQAKLIKSLVLTAPGENHSPSPKPTPSFDCAKASTQVEKTICADAALSQLDAALSANYRSKATFKLGKNQTRFIADQRAWLKQRNTCQTADCLRESYTLRIGQICNDYPVTSDNPPKCITAEEALSTEKEAAGE